MCSSDLGQEELPSFFASDLAVNPPSPSSLTISNAAFVICSLVNFAFGGIRLNSIYNYCSITSVLIIRHTYPKVNNFPYSNQRPRIYGKVEGLFPMTSNFYHNNIMVLNTVPPPTEINPLAAILCK